MAAWEKRVFNWLTVAVTLSGVVYFFFKYFWISDDPFAVTNHPLQSLSLKLHLLAAPALLFVTGMVYYAHARPYLATGRKANRRSGILMLATFGLMALSGYGLQIVSSEWSRQAFLVLHLGSSAAFAGGCIAHVAFSRLLSMRRSANRQTPTGETDRGIGQGFETT